MARLPDLIGFCKKHDLLMITVQISHAIVSIAIM